MDNYNFCLNIVPDLSSCRDFGTYPGFETITGIHINVNFQAFTHLRNKTRFFDKVKYKQNRKQKVLVFYNLKIILASRNQNLILFCSYNIDLTRNHCLFPMREIKSTLFS